VFNHTEEFESNPHDHIHPFKPGVHRQQIKYRDTHHLIKVGFFVTDMSGFTKTVRESGPIHFGSLIMKQRFIAHSVLKTYHFIHTYNEGDDVIAILASGKLATLAALELTNLIRQYNAQVPSDKWKINLSGVGVSHGDRYYVAHDAKIFGKDFSRGFRIGEDMVENCEVCVENSLYLMIKDLPEFANITFVENRSLLESDDLIFWHLDGNINYKCSLPTWSEDGRFVDLFQARLEPNADVESIDNQINQRCLHHGCTVIMFGIVNSRDNLELFIELYEVGIQLIHDAFREHDALILEPTLIVMHDPTKALQAIFQARNAILEYQSKCQGDAQIKVNGFGMHSGSMLYLENEFWIGDPINTASKMGEDRAENMEILVSMTSWELVDQSLFENFPHERKNLEASGNDLPCLSFSV